MLNMGLSVADRALFDAGLGDDHQVRIRVDLLDLDHNVVGTGTGLVISGQIDFDQTAEVERTCSLNLWNPGDVLNLGTANNPGAAAFYADRMVRIWYGVRSQHLDRWVDVPVFTGPITKLEPGDDDTVTITADDKRRLLLVASATSKRYTRGTNYIDAVIDLLHLHGERFIDIPRNPTRIVKDYQCTPVLTAWREVQSLLGSAHEVGTPTYDGRGVLHMRSMSSAPVLRISHGEGGLLITKPKLSFDPSGVVNQVVVTGATPAHAKAPVVATANAAAAHPCSAINLGRGGVPRVIRRDVQDDQITTLAAAQARADAELRTSLTIPADMSLDMVPHPALEPGDTIRVDAGTWVFDWQITKGTLPLTGEAHMSLGKTYAVRNLLRPRVMPRKGNRTPKHTTKPAPRHTATPTHLPKKRK